MTRTWPIIAVTDVVRSSKWYRTLLGAEENHPGAPTFNQILAADGTILVCPHWWGPTGPHGDHAWPPLMDAGRGPAGHGLLLWFVVDDFDAAWDRAGRIGAEVIEPPSADNGTRMRAFVLRDPDGYYVTVNEARP